MYSCQTPYRLQGDHLLLQGGCAIGGNCQEESGFKKKLNGDHGTMKSNKPLLVNIAELLDALAAKLCEYNFDFRSLIRDICKSNTYQRTTKPNATNSVTVLSKNMPYSASNSIGFLTSL